MYGSIDGAIMGVGGPIMKLFPYYSMAPTTYSRGGKGEVD